VTLADLLNELRVSRLDDAVQPYLWSDDELVSFLNDAVRQVCIRQRCLLESTQSFCTINVAAGTQLVPVDPHILAIRFLRQDGSTSNMQPAGITSKRFFKLHATWDTDTDTTGDLEYWVPDYQNGFIALFPLPTADIVLKLNVWRLPIEDEELTLADPTAEPVVNPAWHVDLLDWVVYRAFSKPDSDTEQQARATAAAQTFTAKVGRLPSATEIRLWGVSPIVGSLPQFV